MQVIDRLEEAGEAREAVIAIGTFDGVHLGHQRLISRAAALARELDTIPVVFTFRNHPLSVLAPDRVPPELSSGEERHRVFRSLGVELVLELPFTGEMSGLPAEEFLRMIVERLAPRAIVVGENFSFGAGGRGTPEYLADQGKKLGFRVEKVPLFVRSGSVVSSTRIRALLASGDVKAAAGLLGRPFEMTGEVLHGEERGRVLGFPTANLRLGQREACPADGVYAVRVRTGEGQVYTGVANVGDNPTFGGAERRVEVHLLDFSGDLYGVRIALAFTDRLRGEKRFPSAAALTEQLKEDVRRARETAAAEIGYGM